MNKQKTIIFGILLIVLGSIILVTSKPTNDWERYYFENAHCEFSYPREWHILTDTDIDGYNLRDKIIDRDSLLLPLAESPNHQEGFSTDSDELVDISWSSVYISDPLSLTYIQINSGHFVKGIPEDVVEFFDVEFISDMLAYDYSQSYLEYEVISSVSMRVDNLPAIQRTETFRLDNEYGSKRILKVVTYVLRNDTLYLFQLSGLNPVDYAPNAKIYNKIIGSFKFITDSS